MDEFKNKIQWVWEYVKLGWYVLSCHYIDDGGCSCGRDCRSPGKHPVPPNGCKAATNDFEHVKAVWEQNPKFNIGIATGRESGIFVVDLDGEEGIEAFQKLEAEHGQIPLTPIASTGGGGRHIYFKYPSGLQVRNRVKINGVPIDVRGDEGYVLAPPSDHVSERDYEWVTSPLDTPVAEAPQWVLDLVTSRQSVQPATDAGLVDFDLNLETAPGVPEGQRHSRACQLIGAHLARGESPLDALRKGLAWNKKCDPPSEDEEIERIVRDLHQKDRATALAVQGPWPKLNEAALYGVAGEFVKRIEPHTEADPVAILIQLLVFFGNLIGRSAYFVGVTDKRLLIVETEFASPLKMMRRDGNTLSPIIRLAWDSGNLRIMTKRSPARATNAHISIVGHITREELRRALDDVDVFNGFANRFLWMCVQRSKLLPEGGQRPGMSDIVQQLIAAYEFAQSVGELKRDEGARALWADIYRELADPLPGLAGVVTSRAEAQLLRLSMLYALLDQRSTITAEHLRAAKALLDYATASAQHIFGRSVGDTLADRVLSILGTGAKSRKEIHKALSGHAKGVELDRVLKDLEQRGLAECRKVNTGGRPAEMWSRT